MDWCPFARQIRKLLRQQPTKEADARHTKVFSQNNQHGVFMTGALIQSNVQYLQNVSIVPSMALRIVRKWHTVYEMACASTVDATAAIKNAI